MNTFMFRAIKIQRVIKKNIDKRKYFSGFTKHVNTFICIIEITILSIIELFESFKSLPWSEAVKVYGNRINNSREYLKSEKINNYFSLNFSSHNHPL